MWHLCFPSPLSSGSYLRGKILLWLFLPATTATYYISQCSGTKEVEEWTKTEGNLLHLTITFLDSSKCHELCYRLELHYIISPHSNFESHFMIVIFRTKKKTKNKYWDGYSTISRPSIQKMVELKCDPKPACHKCPCSFHFTTPSYIQTKPINMDYFLYIDQEHSSSYNDLKMHSWMFLYNQQL